MGRALGLAWIGALALLLPVAASAQTGDAPTSDPSGSLVMPPGYDYATAPTPAPPRRGPPPVVAPLDPELASPRPAPRPPAPPGRRGTAEIVELYITAGAFGAFTGVYLPLVTGWARETGSGESSVYYVGGALGAGVLLLVPLGLDQIDGGMPTGVPAAISIGLRYGLGAAAAGLGAGGGGLSGTDVAHLLWWTSLGGGALGALLGYGLRPHPAQVQFVQVAGLWGSILGLAGAFAFAPAAAPGDTTRVGFGIGLGGLLGGIAVGTLLSGLEVSPSARRAWLSTLGLLAGVGAGTVVWAAVAAGTRTPDAQAWGAAAGLGGIAGLVVALLLSDGDTDATHFLAPDTDVTMSAGLAPTEGGLALSLDGRF